MILDALFFGLAAAARSVLVLFAVSQMVVVALGAARSRSEVVAGTGGALYVLGLVGDALDWTVQGHDLDWLLRTVGLSLAVWPLVWVFWPALLADLRAVGSWRRLLRLELRAVAVSLLSPVRRLFRKGQ